MTNNIAAKILNLDLPHNVFMIDIGLWEQVKAQVKRDYILINAERINTQAKYRGLFNIIVDHTNGDGVSIPLSTAVFMVRKSETNGRI